jgi:hypothetical protein
VDVAGSECLVIAVVKTWVKILDCRLFRCLLNLERYLA